MKKKSKLRILSWVTTIAMILSIFNIPIVGYATESAASTEGSEGTVSYSVKVTEFDEAYEPVYKTITESEGNTINGTDRFDYDSGVPYQTYFINCYVDGEQSEISENNDVMISSSNEDVAIVTADECPYEVAGSEVSVIGQGTYTYFRMFYNGVGSTDITVYVNEVEILSFPVEVLAISTDPGAGDEEYICEDCGKSEDECQCWDASIDRLDLTYTLAGDGREYTETIYFDEDNSWAEVTLKPYDAEKPITITGFGANGDAISEDVVFEEDLESTIIEMSSVSPNGNNELGYTVEVYRLTSPMAEITYYIGDEEITKTKYFRYEDSVYAGIPYAHDRTKGIKVTITHLDGTIETPEIDWEDEYQGWVHFESVVNGEKNSYTIDVYKEGPSYDNSCDIRVKAFDEEDNCYSFDIDSTAAMSEDGAIITIPYGYSHRVELYATPCDEYASLDDFYSEGEEENRYVLVSAGDTKTFKVIAENKEEQEYKVVFKESKGNSADVDMSISIRDEALAESEWYGSWREIPIVFAEDENGNKSAEVMLPYMYDDEEGIELCIDSNDSYSFSYENNMFHLGDDNEELVEFTVTSPDGSITKSYSIEFKRESEADSEKTDLEVFTLNYIDENGEDQLINIDPADASDENGATITIPKEVFSEDLEEYYVDLYAKVSGYSYINETHINGYYEGDQDKDYIDYSIDLAWERSVTLRFDVMASNGQDMNSYSVHLINGAKANEADIYDVEIVYTQVNEEETSSDYIDLDDETKTGKYTLYPYDATKPIIITGEGADGSQIYELVTFEEGKNEATVTFTSTSIDGENEITYTVTVAKPEHPLVNVYYKEDGEAYGWECEFSSDYKDKIYIPYNYDEEYGIEFDITLLDGSKLDPAPRIVWENEVREDEHYPLLGKAQFEANGKTYTIDIEVEGVSSNKSAYMYMRAWDGKSYDEWGDKDFIHVDIDSEKATSKEGAIVTIPYNCEDNAYFYIYEEGAYAKIEGYDENGNEYKEAVVPGEVRTYTVTAQDGTTQDYKITFTKSTGNSTAIEADVAVLKDLGENEYEYYTYLEFVKNDDGIMEADVVLPSDYSTKDGIQLYDYTTEKVTYSIPLKEKINIDLDADPSLEFTVTSSNGQVTQDYVINFSKETAEDAAKADIGYMDVSYTDKTGKYIESEIDLEKVQNGNIIINIPENIMDDYVNVYAYTKGYAYVSRFPEAVTDHEVRGKGGADWFNASFERYEKEDIVFKFDITSSDLKNTKSYTVTIKTVEEVHKCKWDNGIVTPPTCTEKGYTTYTCSCGETYTDNYVDATDHSFSDWKVTTAPTCTAKGEETRTCACGEKETRPVDMLPHDYKAAVTAPTCTDAGYTTYTCGCGDTYKADEVAAVGHTPGKFKTTKKATFSKNGEQKATCTVCQEPVTKEIAKAVKPVIKDIAYNGKNKTPVVTVKNTDGTKITSTKKFIKKTRKVVGKYGVKVTINNANYKDTKTVYFKIVPAAKSISKLTAGKKAFTVKWTKATSKNRAQMTGYQIRYSTSSKMSGAKTVTVKSKTATTKTIKKLKAKKTYYVQLRTYKTIKGVKYCSSWSSAKKIKTK